MVLSVKIITKAFDHLWAKNWKIKSNVSNLKMLMLVVRDKSRAAKSGKIGFNLREFKVLAKTLVEPAALKFWDLVTNASNWLTETLV